MKQRQVKIKLNLDEWRHLEVFLRECYLAMLEEKGGLDLILKIATLEKFIFRLQKQLTSWEYQGVELNGKRLLTLDWTEYLMVIDCGSFEKDPFMDMLLGKFQALMPQEIIQKMNNIP